jgi:hypothetical protein
MNPWIQTQTGKAFDLAAPTPAMVDPLDIAVRLARANRFSGSTLRISVAQHSVMAAAAAWHQGFERERRARLLALHDAAEAYIGDVFGPVRKLLTDMARTLVTGYADPRVVMNAPGSVFDLFGALDSRITDVIHVAFNIARPTDPGAQVIRDYDQRQLAFEKIWFVQTPEPQPWWSGTTAPEPFTLDDYGGSLDDHRGLRVAKLVTETWDEEMAAGMYIELLHRLGLLDGPWAMARARLTGYKAIEAIDLLFPVEPV